MDRNRASRFRSPLRNVTIGNVVFSVVVLWTATAIVTVAGRWLGRAPEPLPPVQSLVGDSGLQGAGLRPGPESTHVVTVFTDFRCAQCGALRLRLDSLRAVYPEVKVVERTFPIGEGRASMAAGIYCASDIGALEPLRRAYLVSGPELEDGAWETVARRALIADPQAFAACISSGVHSARVAADSAAIRYLGLTTPPAMIVNDTLYRTPLELTELVPRVRRARGGGR